MSNWINLEIKGKKYYLLCKINEKNEWDSLLYDGNESWYEQQNLETILARVKEQNRRIQFDEATIKETLQGGQPTEVAWLEHRNNDNDEDSRNLKMKYSVKACPFNFTWHFSKQSEHDFQKFILFPLFRIVQGLTQQNKELREVIRKKDVEIKQYKFEFGALKRVTVATQTFNVSNFDERFAETLELSKCMMQISDLLKAQYSQMKTPLKAKASDKTESTIAASRNEDAKLTPRRKRRKFLEEKQRVVAEKMQACQKPFQYESSQSQISSISQSDTEVPGTSRRLLRSPRKSVELKIENDLDETPTKRNRSSRKIDEPRIQNDLDETPTKRNKLTQKLSTDPSPVKPVRRNLNVAMEYDDSSDDDKKEKIASNKNLSQTKANNLEGNNSPSTRIRASYSTSPVKVSTTAADKEPFTTLAKKNASLYDFNDSSEESSQKTKPPYKSVVQATQQTKSTESAINIFPSCSKTIVSIEQNSSVNTAKGTASRAALVSTRLTRKNAGIKYDDSSDSPAEERAYNKPSTPLNATPTKDSNSKITQSPPEQLLDDVQNLIDEWKALEKRRLADLKKRQK